LRSHKVLVVLLYCWRVDSVAWSSFLSWKSRVS